MVAPLEGFIRLLLFTMIVLKESKHQGVFNLKSMEDILEWFCLDMVCLFSKEWLVSE
jgi:hypothetical protein